MMKPLGGCNRLNGANVFYMQLSGASIVACLFVGTALAQSAEDMLRSRLTSVHYAPLAEQARIQGDVRLRLNSGVVTLISGHSLLTRIAVENAKALGSIQSATNLDVTYHFVIVDTARSVPTSTIVKRGNAFERAILRVLGLKTEKVVHGYRCEEGTAPINDVNDVKVNGAAIEVWIYGRTHCLQTNTATLVARR
jgi:hypothetical protein